MGKLLGNDEAAAAVRLDAGDARSDGACFQRGCWRTTWRSGRRSTFCSVVVVRPGPNAEHDATVGCATGHGHAVAQGIRQVRHSIRVRARRERDHRAPRIGL
eukprot:651264-Rhodomonas_salina.3